MRRTDARSSCQSVSFGDLLTSIAPVIVSPLLNFAFNYQILRHRALTRICGRVYNGHAFPRCKSFSMNIFGARSLPAAPAEAASIARHVQVFYLSLGEVAGRETLPVSQSGGGEEVPVWMTL